MQPLYVYDLGFENISLVENKHIGRMRLMEGTALGFDQIIFDQSSLLPIFFVFCLAFPVRPQKVKSVDMQWLV